MDVGLASKVAIIEFDENTTDPLRQAFRLIGGIDELNTAKRSVVIKVGVFSHKAQNHTSVSLVDAIIKSFDEAPKIFLAESDNYKGTALERLQIWKDLFTEQAVPFNLSDDSDTRSVTLADEKMNLSHILFKPNVLVDTHILRTFESGSILKNLFGCIPTRKKMKYHNVLPTLLADVYEAIGGIDLAVLDGTYLWHGAGEQPVRMNTLLVGRDAIAVETVGTILAGLKPKKMPIIQEFVKRGLGEGDLRNIEILGASFGNLREKFMLALKTKKKSRTQSAVPQTWGGQTNRAVKSLIKEGFFKFPNKRTREEVAKALEDRKISTKDKQGRIADILARRADKGILKACKGPNGLVYWTE